MRERRQARQDRRGQQRGTEAAPESSEDRRTRRTAELQAAYQQENPNSTVTVTPKKPLPGERPTRQPTTDPERLAEIKREGDLASGVHPADAPPNLYQQPTTKIDENPFAENTVGETYRPALEGALNQAQTEADQERQSQQQIRDYTGDLYKETDMATEAASQRLGQVQGEGEGAYEQFTQERRDLQAQVMGAPDRVAGQYDAALTQMIERTNAAQSVVDTKESAALAGVMQGKTSAMAAAVQGIQGQVNSQVAQIQSNPNLTDSQKQSMISQVKMQGAMQTAPAIGQTQLQFNQLSAQTATAFGQMTTQIQTAGLAGAGDILREKAKSYENTTNAANQIAAGLLNTQANADSNYVSNMTNLENTRASIEMAGDSLRASLLPAMGKPYANYADNMVDFLQMDIDLMNRDMQNQIGIYGVQLTSWLAAQQVAGANRAGLAEAVQTIGGPLGSALGVGTIALEVLQGFLGGGQEQAPPPPGVPGQGPQPQNTF